MVGQFNREITDQGYQRDYSSADYNNEEERARLASLTTGVQVHGSLLYKNELPYKNYKADSAVSSARRFVLHSVI
jgi:hypothetical protein